MEFLFRSLYFFMKHWYHSLLVDIKGKIYKFIISNIPIIFKYFLKIIINKRKRDFRSKIFKFLNSLFPVCSRRVNFFPRPVLALTRPGFFHRIETRACRILTWAVLEREATGMGCLGNIFWFLFGGLWMGRGSARSNYLRGS